MGKRDWALGTCTELVLSVVVGAASRREVWGIGAIALGGTITIEFEELQIATDEPSLLHRSFNCGSARSLP
ncbi:MULTISPECIES: hypothetical protein [Nostoc]|uniref:hypothetical protein n=1 Tax=Nostoc TaxID=1177 RepID=UPI00168380AD|nr:MULTISPECIES: hypothetical protein [Nostoc]MBD2679657.1 hypothetical protein [Nostoc sp. FACHB-857]